MARIVKTLRIIRIFKLARHSTGLQALGNTMKANYRGLGLLFLLLGMGAIMFASIIIVFEKEAEDTTFKTMFDSYWWAIITMTTVSSGNSPKLSTPGPASAPWSIIGGRGYTILAITKSGQLMLFEYNIGFVFAP